MPKSQRDDIYTRITSHIIAQLDNGVRPWTRPWSTKHAAGRIMRPLRHNGEPYNGINILMLWVEAASRGYLTPTWMTYRQAQKLGGQVCKGEKSALVVYANTITRTEEADDGEEIEHTIPFMRGYGVFNVEQIDGLDDHYYAKPAPLIDPPKRIERAERFFAQTGATVSHGGLQAYYSVTADRIQLPPLQAFRDPESYYATLAHEATHWTRHPSRLNRSFGRKHWGDEGYAREELVAELGAAYLCADLDLTPDVREDHAAYIDHWLRILRSDSRAIFQAAAHAQKATDYLHGLQEAETGGAVC